MMHQKALKKSRLYCYIRYGTTITKIGKIPKTINARWTLIRQSRVSTNKWCAYDEITSHPASKTKKAGSSLANCALVFFL